MNILRKTYFKISIQTYCEISYAINVSNLMHSSSWICLMIMWSTYSTIVLYRIVYKVVTIDWWLCLLHNSKEFNLQPSSGPSWSAFMSQCNCKSPTQLPLSLSLRHAVPPFYHTHLYLSLSLSHVPSDPATEPPVVHWLSFHKYQSHYE